MAKSKKAKNEEQKGRENPDAVVKHQKLCLAIDLENRRIYGYTELQIMVPENGIVGLHADNLAIEKVTVDGEPAEFEVFPHYQDLDPKDRWCVVSTASSAADASGSVYLSSLELELLPNLLIMCSKTAGSDNLPGEHSQLDSGEQAAADSWLGANVKCVRIEYWVEKAETGIHFNDDLLHTNNQFRRARCWFPCMDDSSQFCCYDLEFTVASNFVAVSSGSLRHQVLTKDDPPRKTYIYKLDVPVAAQFISLAVAPFEILPDRHSSLLTHFCMPAHLPILQNTVVSFYNAFSHYEDYLSASFPFGSYVQVFVPPEMAISSCSSGASISIFSSHLLYDEKVIDQTIDTRIKLANALARQWFGVYVTPEAPNDEWLVDGLAGFLTDSYIKRFLGNNEARYRRYKANCAVCQADDSGATALSSSSASKDLYGTQSIGFYGKIRSWKSVAIIQMLEKQMGPESFRKILQNIVMRARDGNRSLRTLSTKEFRHLANKIGNLERPFLKEFFPRWVGSCGCPVLKMGFSYNKRKNLIELAVLRGCTSRPESWENFGNSNPGSDNREGSVGWPGMMSIRVHEFDGTYDHPVLPMAGEPWQLLEIQCHSKLAARRFQKPKKGLKVDGSEDNGDIMGITDVRFNSDSPLLWLRADPEMEYLAEVQSNQPVQMWINQMEKDRDVVAQSQAIAVLEALPQLSFSVVDSLYNILNDSKAFWRVRIEAAYALAITASEDTDWVGLLHLIKFYKSRRFDTNIGLPRPNDFHDFQEYFVLEEIPLAIALVRSSDKKSPREAVEFILQLLKYNDNNGNAYSDVYWVASLIESVGELEFGPQSISLLSSLLKRLDRVLQFDRLMPSHNGVLTTCCILSLAKIALKLSEYITNERIVELIKPYQMSKTWHVRIAASRALLELEFQSKGIDAALTLFIKYLNGETSLRGQTKLGVYALRVSQMIGQASSDNYVKSDTLVSLLRLLESPLCFNNITLRHYVFCILQVVAGRAPTLYGVPRDETLRMGHTKTSSELKKIFAALIKQSKAPEPSLFVPDLSQDTLIPENLTQVEALNEKNGLTMEITTVTPDLSTTPDIQITGSPSRDGHEEMNHIPPHSQDDLMMATNIQTTSEYHEPVEQVAKPFTENSIGDGTSREKDLLIDGKEREPVVKLEFPHDVSIPVKDANEQPDTVSISCEVKRPKFKIRVRGSGLSNRAEAVENTRIVNTQNNEVDRGAGSSVSMGVNQKILTDAVSTGNNQNFEDANSCHDVGSHVTASIGSVKPALDSEEQVKDLQCTADSSKVSLQLPSDNILSSTSPRVDTEPQKKEKKKKDKEKKRKKHGHDDDDPGRRELKRLKKEKKRKEKEMAKILAEAPKPLASTDEKSTGADISEAKILDKQRESVPSNEVSSQENATTTAVISEAKLAFPESETRQEVDDVKAYTSSVKELSKVNDTATISGNEQLKPAESSEPNAVLNRTDSSVSAPRSAPSHKIKIKFKRRPLDS